MIAVRNDLERVSKDSLKHKTRSENLLQSHAPTYTHIERGMMMMMMVRIANSALDQRHRREVTGEMGPQTMRKVREGNESPSVEN